LIAELRRRGVLGAVTAYAVIAAGGLQLADIVVHALGFPGWSLRALVWAAAVGLPLTFAISWFWDLTRHGFVRTLAPGERPASPAASPERPAPDPERYGQAVAALQAAGPGTVLSGRYQVERELGAGGMGRVLAARDLRLGRRVAVKVVMGAYEPSRLRRFEQEARTAGALEHPNVLAVYDLGDQDGVPFLVTELLEGRTLRKVIDEGSLPAEEAKGIAVQLARGLAAAHATGVVHRDLKPENLFLTRDGRLKILDFGMAKLLAPEASQGPGLTMTGVLFGSPGYLSPEQARGEPAGPASDVFSAGAVLYELLSGRRAFPGASLVEAGHAAISLEPPPLPATVPAALAEVITRALAKAPKARFADGADLARALDQAPGLAKGALRPSRGEGGAGRRWRVPAPLSLGVAVVAVGVAVASALFVHPETVREQSSAGRAETRAEREPPEPPAPDLTSPGVPSPPELRNVPGLDPEAFARQMSQVPRVGGTTPGLMGGVSALESMGQAAQAEKLLVAYLRERPDDLGMQLELAALRRRHGERQRADAALLKLAKTLQGDDWMKPLVRAWAGLIPEEAALKAAQVEGDDEETSARTTQAYYYLGLKRETDDPAQPQTARRYFKKSIDSNGDVPEQGLAEEALERLVPGRHPAKASPDGADPDRSAE